MQLRSTMQIYTTSAFILAVT